MHRRSLAAYLPALALLFLSFQVLAKGGQSPPPPEEVLEEGEVFWDGTDPNATTAGELTPQPDIVKAFGCAAGTEDNPTIVEFGYNDPIELPPRTVIQSMTLEVADDFITAEDKQKTGRTEPNQGSCPIDGGECTISWSRIDKLKLGVRDSGSGTSVRYIKTKFRNWSHNYSRHGKLIIKYSTF